LLWVFNIYHLKYALISILWFW